MQVSACGSLCLQIITPFTIYFNARFIYQKWELWRLLTNFMYFGSLGELCHRTLSVAIWSPGRSVPILELTASHMPGQPNQAQAYAWRAEYSKTVVIVYRNNRK